MNVYVIKHSLLVSRIMSTTCDTVKLRKSLENGVKMQSKILKQCTKCNKLCQISQFNKDSSKKDGLHSHCKECKSRGDKLYKENNAAKCREMNRAY
jgi:hypothetical protein